LFSLRSVLIMLLMGAMPDPAAMKVWCSPSWRVKCPKGPLMVSCSPVVHWWFACLLK